MSKSIQINKGTRVGIIANPNPNYRFINWTVVKGSLSENLNSRELSFIANEDTTLVANFDRDSIYHIDPSEIDNAGSSNSYVKNEYKNSPYNWRVHSNGNVIVVDAFLTFDLNSRFKDDITNVQLQVLDPSNGRLPMNHTLMFNGSIKDITNHNQINDVGNNKIGHFTINRAEAEELGYVRSSGTSGQDYKFAFEKFTIRYIFTFKDGSKQTIEKPFREL